MVITTIAYRVVLVAIFGLVAAGDGGDSASSSQDDDSAPTSNALQTNTEIQTTAEDLLRELQHRRPINTVILPFSAQNRDDLSAEGKLWPEGWAVTDRSGRLERHGSWWFFRFEADEGTAPIKVLPNATLEVMTRILAGSPNAQTFAVSGELTVYGDENYLLARTVRRPSEAPPSDRPVDPEPAGQPDIPAEASAEEVLAVLQAQQPVGALLPVEGLLLDNLAAPETFSGRTFWPDGSPIVSRLGRVIPKGSWWAFTFESDPPDSPEPPMRLLPNKNTELMVQASRHESVGLVFVVSGEVTAFYGENFLLPRMTMRRTDLGNLRN